MEETKDMNEEFLRKQADEVFRQLAENPDQEIEISYELAEFMGAYEEEALSDYYINKDK